MTTHNPVEHRVTVDRTARVYTLGNVQATEAWVVLHGYGQLAARFIGNFAHVAGKQRVIVAPEALNRFYLDAPRAGISAENRRVGTTWMTREDRVAEIADYVAYLDRILGGIAPRATNVTVLGFSQGVATACRWVALGSTQVQRLILWAGPIPPDLDLRLLAKRTNGSPVEFVIGTQDPISEPVGLEQQLAVLQGAGIESRLTRFEGGHQLDEGLLARFAAA